MKKNRLCFTAGIPGVTRFVLRSADLLYRKRWSLSVLFGLFLILSDSSVQAQGFRRHQVLPAPIPTNSRSFSIPFEVKPDQSTDPVKEVELLVSKDQGVRWHVQKKQPIEAGHFDFKAETDGEYWFAFRIITLSGQTRQIGQGQPQLRVLVDTVAPKLTLQATRQSDGSVLVRWKVSDDHLQGKRPDFSLSLSKDTPENPWRSLEVDGRFLKASETELEGNFVFRPESTGSEIRVRAVADDQAGNRTEIIEPLAPEGPARPAAETPRREPVVEPKEPESVSPDGPVRVLENNDAKIVPPSRPEQAAVMPERTVSPQYSGYGTPIAPPKPMRLNRKTGKEKTIVFKADSPAAGLNAEYQPAPTLGSPKGGPNDKGIVLEPTADLSEAEKKATEKLNDQLLAEMDQFFDGQLAREIRELEHIAEKNVKPDPAELAELLSRGPVLPKIEPIVTRLPVVEKDSETALEKTPGPAPRPALPDRIVAENRDTAIPVKPLPDSTVPAEPPQTQQPPKPKTPGSITAVAMNTTSEQPQIIVKWVPLAGSKGVLVDVLRGETASGPWQPIATNLPDKGEYWWFLSSIDLQPFHLMVRLRVSPENIYTDLTRSPIQIDPKQLRR